MSPVDTVNCTHHSAWSRSLGALAEDGASPLVHGAILGIAREDIKRYIFDFYVRRTNTAVALRMPPLSALRAFEAAARLESFSRAADEIHVTHGAVSHQVRALEGFLGVALFVRSGRRVALTADGRYFAERVRAALIQIGEAAASISRPERANRLRISVLPSFGARWLLPRVGRFMERHPGLDLSIETTTRLADFSRDEADVAIRFGRGNWPNVNAELFMSDEFFPVCSPSFNGGRLPKRPAELMRYPLLLASEGEYWAPWFREAKLDLPEPAQGTAFSDAALMLQAAIDGRGIALARRSIAEADLANGSLVRLFDIALQSDWSYFLVWPKHSPPSAALDALRAWLHEERQHSP